MRQGAWVLVSYEKEPWDREENLDRPAAGRLAEIRVPLLAVHGELDIPSMEHVIDLLANEGSRTRKLPDVAHLAPW